MSDIIITHNAPLFDEFTVDEFLDSEYDDEENIVEVHSLASKRLIKKYHSGSHGSEYLTLFHSHEDGSWHGYTYWGTMAVAAYYGRCPWELNDFHIGATAVFPRTNQRIELHQLTEILSFVDAQVSKNPGVFS